MQDLYQQQYDAAAAALRRVSLNLRNARRKSAIHYPFRNPQGNSQRNLETLKRALKDLGDSTPEFEFD